VTGRTIRGRPTKCAVVGDCATCSSLVRTGIGLVAEEGRSTGGAEPPVGDRAGEKIGITREHEPAAPALTAGETAIVLGGRYGCDIAGLGRGGDRMKRRRGRHDPLSRTCVCDSVTRCHELEEPLADAQWAVLFRRQKNPNTRSATAAIPTMSIGSSVSAPGQSPGGNLLQLPSQHTLVKEY
jgi:hypothetical protein